MRLQPSQWTFAPATVSGVGQPVEGFSLTFTYHASAQPAPLIEIPGVLSVGIVDGFRPNDDYGQNYIAAPMPDGSVPALEAVLSLRLPTVGNPVEKMRVGVPLARLQQPWGKHDVVLTYSGARWTLFVDGYLVDNDFPFGQPAAEVSEGHLLVNNIYVDQVRLIRPALRATRVMDSPQALVPLQYFTPEGHNAWVGDVATCYYHGRYHLFYLYDRRGHRSKLGRGGHYFEHISTADFHTWTELPEATPIEEQWESLGTGTPFVYHDSLFLSYGMHTSRLFPAERTASPMQWDSIRIHGRSSAIPFASLQENSSNRQQKLYPSGASYSVAADELGEHFEKSHILIHPAENPTIYLDDDRLMMLANYGARGTWSSDRLDGGWHCLSEDFPPGGDCTFIFQWGAFDYIVGGFTHQWMKRHTEPITAYRDLVAEGRDLYDGLSVPAITALPDGRHIMAGWMTVNRHWGGPLVLRELVQNADGTIGSRWMPELIPAHGRESILSRSLREPHTFITDSMAYMLSFRLVPRQQQSARRLRLLFLPAEGETDACEWAIDMDAARAQFSPGSMTEAAPPQKSLREGGAPQAAIDYAIEHLPLTANRAVPVRIISKWSPKLDGTLIDVEIAGQRTMICYRHKLRPGRLYVVPEGTQVSDFRMSVLNSTL